jgi:hypothetical protein
MSTTTKEEKTATRDLIEKCRVYLLDNFHKFTEANRIKIALALIVKSIPTQIEGDNLPGTKIIIIRDGNKAQAVSGQVHLQQGEIPSDGVVVGDGKVNVRNLPGYDILRADTEQPGNSLS